MIVFMIFDCVLIASMNMCQIQTIMSLTTLNNSHQNQSVMIFVKIHFAQSFVNCYIIRLSGLSRVMIECKLLNRLELGQTCKIISFILFQVVAAKMINTFVGK